MRTLSELEMLSIERGEQEKEASPEHNAICWAALLSCGLLTGGAGAVLVGLFGASVFASYCL